MTFTFTTTCLQKDPHARGIFTDSYSILNADSSPFAIHRGYYAGYLRYHLGILKTLTIMVVS